MERRISQNCRWAEPTLFMPMPYWLDSWKQPWTCRRDKTPHLIDDPDACAACPRWRVCERPAPFGAE